MKKILLCCSAGMSTSLMVNKMQKAAADKGIEVEIWAEPMDKASSEVPKADVVLLEPQIKFALPEIKKLLISQEMNLEKVNNLIFQVNFDFFFLNDCFV